MMSEKPLGTTPQGTLFFLLALSSAWLLLPRIRTVAFSGFSLPWLQFCWDFGARSLHAVLSYGHLRPPRPHCGASLPCRVDLLTHSALLLLPCFLGGSAEGGEHQDRQSGQAPEGCDHRRLRQDRGGEAFCNRQGVGPRDFFPLSHHLCGPVALRAVKTARHRAQCCTGPSAGVRWSGPLPSHSTGLQARFCNKLQSVLTNKTKGGVFFFLNRCVGWVLGPPC